MAVKPISPDEVLGQKKASIPDVVFEVFNELIAEDYSNGYSSFRQDEVVKRLVKKGLKRAEIFDKGWLDIEGIYRDAGWKVEYDSPGYNEDYPAIFNFSKKS